MDLFDIIAHRGIVTEEPENTLPAFLRAIELGADGLELDVRLTSDHVPVVYHYCYLDMNTSAQGVIFEFSFEQLRQLQVIGKGTGNPGAGIPTLREVLETVGGRIGLEIEIKGPEPEAPSLIGGVLKDFRSLWESIEVTSYEPALLKSFQETCPGIATDLLFPSSESWMKLDVVAYQTLHSARLARARAVHLHPTQLSFDVVSAIRKQWIDVHAWDVNEADSLEKCLELKIPRICTDRFLEAFEFRRKKIQDSRQAPHSLN
jgi:glycerophosphoryl diester phosphodiesterase